MRAKSPTWRPPDMDSLQIKDELATLYDRAKSLRTAGIQFLGASELYLDDAIKAMARAYDAQAAQC